MHFTFSCNGETILLKERSHSYNINILTLFSCLYIHILSYILWFVFDVFREQCLPLLSPKKHIVSIYLAFPFFSQENNVKIFIIQWVWNGPLACIWAVLLTYVDKLNILAPLSVLVFVVCRIQLYFSDAVCVQAIVMIKRWTASDLGIVINSLERWLHRVHPPGL
jgi:hypothetical protein